MRGREAIRFFIVSLRRSSGAASPGPLPVRIRHELCAGRNEKSTEPSDAGHLCANGSLDTPRRAEGSARPLADAVELALVARALRPYADAGADRVTLMQALRKDLEHVQLIGTRLEHRRAGLPLQEP
jgi:hypothetical protein